MRHPRSPRRFEGTQPLRPHSAACRRLPYDLSFFVSGDLRFATVLPWSLRSPAGFRRLNCGLPGTRCCCSHSPGRSRFDSRRGNCSRSCPNHRPGKHGTIPNSRRGGPLQSQKDTHHTYPNTTPKHSRACRADPMHSPSFLQPVAFDPRCFDHTTPVDPSSCTVL